MTFENNKLNEDGLMNAILGEIPTLAGNIKRSIGPLSSKQNECYLNLGISIYPNQGT